MAQFPSHSTEWILAISEHNKISLVFQIVQSANYQTNVLGIRCSCKSAETFLIWKWLKNFSFLVRIFVKDVKKIKRNVTVWIFQPQFTTRTWRFPTWIFLRTCVGSLIFSTMHFKLLDIAWAAIKVTIKPLTIRGLFDLIVLSRLNLFEFYKLRKSTAAIHLSNRFYWSLWECSHSTTVTVTSSDNGLHGNK